MRVLVVDEVEPKRNALAKALRAANVQPDELADVDDVLAHVEAYEPVVLVLCGVPTATALDVVREARRKRMMLPILVVTECSWIASRIELLKAGADDVVSRATATDELVVRVQSLTRRVAGAVSAVITVGRLALDLDAGCVSVDGVQVALTRMQFSMLELLMLRRFRVVSRSHFMDHFYGAQDDAPCPKVIDVVICHVRRRLKAAGLENAIANVWGRGYQLVDPGSIANKLAASAPCALEMAEAV